MCNIRELGRITDNYNCLTMESKKLEILKNEEMLDRKFQLQEEQK